MLPSRKKKPKCTIVITRCVSSFVRSSYVRRPLFTFSTSPLKPLNGIQRNLTGSKITTSTTKFVFFGANRKSKMATLASEWLDNFLLLLRNSWTEFNETWQEGRSQLPLQSCVFRADRKNKMAALASVWLRHVQLLFWSHLTEFNEQDGRPVRSVNKGGTLYSGARHVAFWVPCF